MEVPSLYQSQHMQNSISPVILSISTELLKILPIKNRSHHNFEVLQQELIDIIDFLPDPIFIIDNEHRVTAWNSAIEQMTGVSKNEILGHTEFAHAFPFYGTSRMILIDLIDASDDEIKKYYPDLKREGRSLVTKIFAPSLYSGQGAYLLARGITSLRS